MNKIQLDTNNYRIHNDKNRRIIRKSLEDLGAGRSIVVDNENFIIAGNGVYEQAQELGLKTRIVESDGTELIVVKRTDIATNDEKRKLLALVDNHSSDTSEFDMDLIFEDFDVADLEVWEFNIDDVFLDEIPDQLTQPKKDSLPSIKVTFQSIKQMNSFERELKTVLKKFEGAFYSISAGEI
ncbi:MAG: hypothetical protein FWD66_01035 [Paludibacter sp.]|nr:hypothetical protein [Paludibacter sp.]